MIDAQTTWELDTDSRSVIFFIAVTKFEKQLHEGKVLFTDCPVGKAWWQGADCFMHLRGLVWVIVGGGSYTAMVTYLVFMNCALEKVKVIIYTMPGLSGGNNLTRKVNLTRSPWKPTSGRV